VSFRDRQQRLVRLRLANSTQMGKFSRGGIMASVVTSNGASRGSRGEKGTHVGLANLA